ncbi:hypothetical protein KJ660_03375, partial [Candidatus Micrarchaeota archaeon]|nr:hypothetical protein [Candidatus Micrarchaeota archaeon]
MNKKIIFTSFTILFLITIISSAYAETFNFNVGEEKTVYQKEGITIKVEYDGSGLGFPTGKRFAGI